MSFDTYTVGARKISADGSIVLRGRHLALLIMFFVLIPLVRLSPIRFLPAWSVVAIQATLLVLAIALLVSPVGRIVKFDRSAQQLTVWWT